MDSNLIEFRVDFALRLTDVVATVEGARTNSRSRQFEFAETDFATNVVVTRRATVTFDELARFALVVVGGVLGLLDLRVEVRIGRTWCARYDQSLEGGHFGL